MPIKQLRGRSRKPEEEKKRTEKPIKPPRVKKERHYEEHELLKTGRKKGHIANLGRYLLDGTYRALDKDYHKKHSREVIRFSGAVCCDLCKATLANKQGLGKHKNAACEKVSKISSLH